MKIKITSRDTKFFFLGIFAAFVFATTYNWEGSINAVKEGYEAGQKANPLP